MSVYGSYDERIKIKREREERAKYLDSHGPTTDQEAEAWKKERRALAILLGSGSTDLHKREANATLDELQVQREQAEKEVNEGEIVEKVLGKLRDDGTIPDETIPTF